MEGLIEIKDLYKRFGKFEVLKGVNFKIFKEECFGLLGPNAAGKTTLIRCLLRILKKSKGEIFFAGKQLSEEDVYRHFGYLPENFSPPKQLTPVDFLSLLGKKKVRIKDALAYVGLEKQANKRIKSFSRGMVQRLGFAFILINEPEVIILDEPTLGLDPLGQIQITQLIKRMKNEGKTIFICSHILSQIEKVVDRVGIMDKGRVLYEGWLTDFLDKNKSQNLEEAFLKELRNERNI